MGWFPDILLFLQSTSPTEIKYNLPTRDMFSFLENPASAENTDNQTMVFRKSSCSGTFNNLTEHLLLGEVKAFYQYIMIMSMEMLYDKLLGQTFT